jgi:hypothetical protein
MGRGGRRGGGVLATPAVAAVSPIAVRLFRTSGVFNGEYVRCRRRLIVNPLTNTARILKAKTRGARKAIDHNTFGGTMKVLCCAVTISFAVISSNAWAQETSKPPKPPKPPKLELSKDGDAGSVVVSFATTLGYSPALCVRRLDDNAWRGLSARGLKAKVSDFTVPPPQEVTHNLEHSQYKVKYLTLPASGMVANFALAPGLYEAFRIELDPNACSPKASSFARVNDWQKAPKIEDFSLKFEVKSNQAVYLGSYRALSVMGENFLFHTPVPAGARFTVTDESARDLAIVKARLPAMGPMENASPDGDALQSSVLSSTP